MADYNMPAAGVENLNVQYNDQLNIDCTVPANKFKK